MNSSPFLRLFGSIVHIRMVCKYLVDIVFVGLIELEQRNFISGTFITEFDAGKEICRQLLSSDENVDRAVDALALMMAWYSFDGYLLNIENPIEVNFFVLRDSINQSSISDFQPDQIARLLSFVTKLKSACAKIDPNSVIIWYDSVTIHGELKWQNQLNSLNQ